MTSFKRIIVVATLLAIAATVAIILILSESSSQGNLRFNNQPNGYQQPAGSFSQNWQYFQNQQNQQNQQQRQRGFVPSQPAGYMYSGRGQNPNMPPPMWGPGGPAPNQPGQQTAAVLASQIEAKLSQYRKLQSELETLLARYRSVGGQNYQQGFHRPAPEAVEAEPVEAEAAEVEPQEAMELPYGAGEGQGPNFEAAERFGGFEGYEGRQGYGRY
jgi:hypothetical protein